MANSSVVATAAGSCCALRLETSVTKTGGARPDLGTQTSQVGGTQQDLDQLKLSTLITAINLFSTNVFEIVKFVILCIL
jgi:hypothetical protein